MTRLYVGCVSREVVAAVSRHIAAAEGKLALVASRAQVGPGGEGGYCGWPGAGAECVELWRDHMTIDSLQADEAAGFAGFMLDTDDPRIYEHAASLGVRCEIGCGEDRTGSARERWRTAVARGVEIHCVSGWVGSRLRDGQNVLDRGQAIIGVQRLLALHPRTRAHNCDWLSREDLRFLRDRGVEEFNIAPELGFATTRAALELGCVDAAKLEAATKSHGGWSRWHERDWRYGAHYALGHVRGADWPWEDMIARVTAWLDQRLEDLGL